MTALPPVCILAGGLGTRLGAPVPKTIVDVAGEPFALHQLRLLRESGAREVVYCVGHGGELVEATIGDGSRLGLSIRYSHDGPEPLGTAGAVRAALPLLGDEFLVLYGDTYLRVDYAAVAEARRRGSWVALMTVLHNDGRWGPSNADFDGRRVVRHDKRAPDPGLRWIDYGLGALTPAALDPPHDDLSDVYAELAATGRLGGFEASRRFYEIGSPAALAETDAFLRAAARS